MPGDLNLGVEMMADRPHVFENIMGSAKEHGRAIYIKRNPLAHDAPTAPRLLPLRGLLHPVDRDRARLPGEHRHALPALLLRVVVRRPRVRPDGEVHDGRGREVRVHGDGGGGRLGVRLVGGGRGV